MLADVVRSLESKENLKNVLSDRLDRDKLDSLGAVCLDYLSIINADDILSLNRQHSFSYFVNFKGILNTRLHLNNLYPDILPECCDLYLVNKRNEHFNRFEIVYYPRHQVENYSLIARESRRAGPSDSFPGSHAVLDFEHCREEGYFKVRSCQSSLNIKYAREKGFFTEQLIVHKNKFRVIHATLFSIAKDLGLKEINFNLPKHPEMRIQGRLQDKQAIFYCEFQAAAKKLGWNVSFSEAAKRFEAVYNDTYLKPIG